MRVTSLCACHFIIAVLGLNSLGQDAKKAELLKAIGKLASTDIGLVGAIEEEKPSDVSGASTVQTIFASGAEPKKDFSGEVEMGVWKDNTIGLVSKEAFPGLKLLKSPQGLLCNQTHSEEPVDAKKLAESLAKLLNWEELSKAIESSSKLRVSAKDKSTDIRVVLDASWIVPPAPAMAPVGGAAGKGIQIRASTVSMAPSPVDLTATFTLDGSSSITGITFEVQYDDPMKSLMARSMKAGGGAIRIGPGAKVEGDDVTLGKLIRYDFDVQASPPASVATFTQEALKLLAK